MKFCPDCGQRKPMALFWRNKATRDGRAHYCIECFKERNRRSAALKAECLGRTLKPRNKRPVVPEGKKWCPGCEAVWEIEEFVHNSSTPSGRGAYCRSCQRQKSAASLKRLYGSSRHYHLRRRYGIGADQVAEMLSSQDARCPICRLDLTLDTAHVDHDHQTGAVRGILCFNCNGGLGQFRDSPEVLRRAADYLELDLEDLLAPEPTEADAIRRLEAAFGRRIDVA